MKTSYDSSEILAPKIAKELTLEVRFILRSSGMTLEVSQKQRVSSIADF